MKKSHWLPQNGDRATRLTNTLSPKWGQKVKMLTPKWGSQNELRGTDMIIDLLPRGKENAISTEALLQASGATSVRELRKMIANERKDGKIIASISTGGYYIPNDTKEVEDFVRTLDSKARSIMIALQSARKLLKTTSDENQMVLQSDSFRPNVDNFGGGTG